MRPTTLRASVVLLGCLFSIGIDVARADGVVTLCAADNQPGSGLNLRNAITAGGRITFACPANTVLRITARHTIDTVVEIDGGNNVTLDAAGSTSVFRSSAGLHNRTLTLRNLIIKGGKPDSDDFVPPGKTGAITVSFTGGTNHLILDHIQINSTERPVSVPFGAVTVRDSQFSGNTGPVLQVGNAVGEPASLDVHHSIFADTRGQVFWSMGAAVLIEDADVTGRADSTGQASEFTNGTLLIRNSRFSSMWSSQCGGALKSSGQTTIANSSFTNNRSSCGGGALYVTQPATSVLLRAVIFSENQTDGRGGAVALEELTGTAQIVHGEFRNNSAAWGGGVSIHSTSASGTVVDATAVSFKGNSATQGGGAIYLESVGLRLSRGIFVDNQASAGGALLLAGSGPPTLLLGNAIVARNTSKAGAALEGITGDIVNSSITANTGGGLSVLGHVRLTNTVLASNQGKNCISAGGVIEDGGTNVQFPGIDCPSTIPSAAPMFDSFYVPDLNSPLQRAGNNAACLATPVNGRDVYGQKRPRSDRCTIGAVEGELENVLNKIGVTAATASAGKVKRKVPTMWWLLLLLLILLVLLLLLRLVFQLSILKLILATACFVVIVFLWFRFH
jgi:predicted outer membrane repeat protein